jgi:hypothetical protein
MREAESGVRESELLGGFRVGGIRGLVARLACAELSGLKSAGGEPAGILRPRLQEDDRRSAIGYFLSGR